MTSFQRLAVLAIISRAYTLNSVDALLSQSSISSSTRESSVPLLRQISNHHRRHNRHLHRRSNNCRNDLSSTSLLMADRRNSNPIQSFFGDVASSMLSSVGGGANDNGKNEELDKALNGMASLLSWGDIRSKLTSQQTIEEKAFRSNVEKGIGEASPLNKVRLFDESNKEEDIRVVLYRDSASWCPYCQKVWMTLEEKRIPYKIEKVNMRCYGEKPSSFLRLQPSGNIPVAIIDGQIYNQSNDIMYALEQLFPNHKKLLPSSSSSSSSPNEIQKAQSLLNLERTLFSAWMRWLTGSERSKNAFIAVLKEVDAELSNATGGDFFLGKDVSIVDFMFAPFLERMCASLLFFKGYQIRVPPNEQTEFKAVNKWFDAMETLESYRLTKSDYYTHCWDLPPQLGGCTYEKGGEPYEKVINGEKTLSGTSNKGSWEFPLQPHNGGVEPDWTWCGDEAMNKREAVERLSFNHGNIVSFAARGAGKKGMPGYMAALSDPNATPSEAVKGSVDACLRAISMALVEGDNDNTAANGIMDEVATTISKHGGKDQLNDVVASLAYLRDRVGVPRDMRLPAARQLRAQINWAIEKLI